MWAEPTGWAVSMYSDTTAFRMAALRSSSAARAPGVPMSVAAASCPVGHGAVVVPCVVCCWGALCRASSRLPWSLALDSTECHPRPRPGPAARRLRQAALGSPWTPAASAVSPRGAAPR